MKVFIDDVIVDGEVKGQLYIESDTYGYQVKTVTGTRTDDKGKEIELSTTHGYYHSVSSCVRQILNMKVKESTATNLVELLREVEGIKAYIESKVSV